VNLTEIFGQNGLLSQAIFEFTPRESQQKMAEAIEKAIEFHSELIVEAGTGTGKTFGYLIPIFLSQKKTIISTGTKNLQDQLFFTDIPVIKKIFSFPLKVVLLKGRANYLCKQRVERNKQEGLFVSRHLVSELYTIDAWAKTTETGDISELSTVAEDSAIWPSVTSTSDNCLGQECPFYQGCFIVKARTEALTADIVVVNHHLFFADRALQEEGFGELLPGAEVVVFDEAHQLPDIASQFFSTQLTSRQLMELTHDTLAESAESANDMRELPEKAHQLQTILHDMRLMMGPELRRLPWPDPLPHLFKTHIQSVKDILQSLEEILKIAAVRSKGLENCWRRSLELMTRFHLLTGNAPPNIIHWYETYPQSFTLQFTPMIVADSFRAYLEEKKRTWIFTSATLAVKNSFQLFIDSLGLQKALQLQLSSPFNYQQQAILYVPRHLPDPRKADYMDHWLEAVIPVLELTEGRTFLLFTSYRAMEYAHELLKDRVSFPLLLQGTLPKKELIAQFKALKNAVLLGTNSFWYGVDVRGDALSCVIIDKLPFAAPDDPILKARINLLRKQGSDPFYSYQLPNAVLILKQGAGRLIRDIKDRGILMICDPRLVGSHYGEAFLQSLPPMRRTREMTKVNEFWTQPSL